MAMVTGWMRVKLSGRKRRIQYVFQYPSNAISSPLDICCTPRSPSTVPAREGVYPNVRSYTGAIAACSKVGDGNKAIDWLRVMWRKGVTPEVQVRPRRFFFPA